MAFISSWNWIHHHTPIYFSMDDHCYSCASTYYPMKCTVKHFWHGTQFCFVRKWSAFAEPCCACVRRIYYLSSFLWGCSFEARRFGRSACLSSTFWRLGWRMKFLWMLCQCLADSINCKTAPCFSAGFCSGTPTVSAFLPEFTIGHSWIGVADWQPERQWALSQ